LLLSVSAICLENRSTIPEYLRAAADQNDHRCRSPVLVHIHPNGDLMPTNAKKQLNELFHDTLKDIYYAEKKILSSLPKMAKAAHAPELKAAFEKHETETEGQIERLEEVFEIIQKPARGKKCEAIDGILGEGKEIMQGYKGSPALDAGLLAAAQAVEHYEISRYGTLKAWAGKLALTPAVSLLEQTLQQEKKTDADLSKIAETAVNAEAEEER
jgi:ferritin-like metal-binding protein YciE